MKLLRSKQTSPIHIRAPASGSCLGRSDRAANSKPKIILEQKENAEEEKKQKELSLA